MKLPVALSQTRVASCCETDAIMLSLRFDRLVIFWAISYSAAASSPVIGDQGCVVGYVMDRYCIDRGTLFDNPTVETLVGPEVHSVHCLLDVPPCLASPFEILLNPTNGTGRYVRGWTLSDAAKSDIVAKAYANGVCGGECTGTVVKGFRVQFHATVVDLGTSSTPPTVDASNVTVIDITQPGALDIACPMDQELIGVQTTVDPAIRFRKVALAHGSLMLISWGWLLPSGVILARFLKHRPNDLWFKIHAVLQPVALILAIIGWSVALRNFDVLGSPGTNMYNHGVLGITTMVLGLLQPLNAVFRPHAPNEGETASSLRSAWEWVHKSLGYVAILLAIPTIALGTLNLNPSDAKTFQIAYGAGAGGLLLITLSLLCIDRAHYKILTGQTKNLVHSDHGEDGEHPTEVDSAP